MWTVNRDVLAYAVSGVVALDCKGAGMDVVYFSSEMGVAGTNGRAFLCYPIHGEGELAPVRVSVRELKLLKIPVGIYRSIKISAEGDNLRFASDGWSQNIPVDSERDVSFAAFKTILSARENEEITGTTYLAGSILQVLGKVLPKNVKDPVCVRSRQVKLGSSSCGGPVSIWEWTHFDMPCLFISVPMVEEKWNEQ